MPGCPPPPPSHRAKATFARTDGMIEESAGCQCRHIRWHSPMTKSQIIFPSTVYPFASLVWICCPFRRSLSTPPNSPSQHSSRFVSPDRRDSADDWWPSEASGGRGPNFVENKPKRDITDNIIILYYRMIPSHRILLSFGNISHNWFAHLDFHPNLATRNLFQKNVHGIVFTSSRNGNRHFGVRIDQSSRRRIGETYRKLGKFGINEKLLMGYYYLIFWI